MPILDAALGLLEETAAEGQGVQEVLGDDIAAFCDDLVKDSPTYAEIHQESLRAEGGAGGQD